MTYLEQAEQVVLSVLELAEREGKASGFCIGNTAKIDSRGLFFSPIRQTRQIVAGSVIVYRIRDAAAIAEVADGRVDYLLVDSEKKAGPDREHYGPDNYGNIERAVRDVVRHSRILTYKGNDLTVDSIDCLLAQFIADPVIGMGGKKVAVVGAGNLGSKLALKLVERGASVVLTRRSLAKLDDIVRGLNAIKPVRTIAEVVGTTDNEEAARDANILIGCAGGTAVVTASMIDAVSEGALIVDAGKGCLFPEAVLRANERDLTLLRVDIRPGFEGQVAMLLEMERQLQASTGRATLGGVNIVSGGLLGRTGEFVVDSVHEPTVIYGLADGRGDLVRDLSVEQLKQLRSLRNLIRVEVG